MPNPAETKLVACIWHRFDQWLFPEWLATEFGRRYPALQVVHLPDYQRLSEEIVDAHVFVGWSLRPEQFACARRLKWIHCLGAGVNQLMREDIRSSPVVITNSRGVHAPCMAEHTLGLLLALARRLPSAVRYQSKRQWAQQEVWDEEPHPMEVSGRTVVIVGYGAIGTELAGRARACGMRVVAVKRDPTRGGEQADKVVSSAQLHEALAEADFVVLAVPVTPTTEHFFGQREFKAMKRTAYLINVGRGALIDAEAMIRALRGNVIAGAAIDVTEVEPLPPDSPLWDAPNLLITPHLSAVSEQLWQRHAALLFDNLERYFAGRELKNLVDKERGY